MEFPKAWGVKIWKPSVVGYGYFLELPNQNGLKTMQECWTWGRLQVVSNLGNSVEIHVFVKIISIEEMRHREGQ